MLSYGLIGKKMNKQGYYFNRMWFEHDEWRKKVPKNYVPLIDRKDFDERKIIKLDNKGNKYTDKELIDLGLLEIAPDGHLRTPTDKEIKGFTNGLK